MPRRDRQRAELIAMCATGSARRAIDLAFGHLTEFGPDDDLLARMQAVLDGRDLTPADRRRFDDLRHSRQPAHRNNETERS